MKAQIHLCQTMYFKNSYQKISFSFIGYTALVGPGRFLTLLIFSLSVGLLGRVVSPSQDPYLNAG
jgi:hypothetical protein